MGLIMSISVVTGSIAAGDSMSGVVDRSTSDVVSLIMPAGWNDARLTFQVSIDGTDFHDVFDQNGHEVQVTVTVNSAIAMPDNYFGRIRFIKFRSGTRDAPVVQAEQRDMTIVLNDRDAPASSFYIPIKLVP